MSTLTEKMVWVITEAVKQPITLSLRQNCDYNKTLIMCKLFEKVINKPRVVKYRFDKVYNLIMYEIC